MTVSYFNNLENVGIIGIDFCAFKARLFTSHAGENENFPFLIPPSLAAHSNLDERPTTSGFAEKK